MASESTGALASYLGPGWRLNNGGYYVHRGRVYLQGSVTNDGGFDGLNNLRSPRTVTAVILTGLPGALRPTASVALTMIQVGIPEDVATPGIEEPPTYPAHVNPTGVLALDTLPPYINQAPGGGLEWIDGTGERHKYFDLPLGYVISLGNVSWPLAAESDSPPSYQSLAPYLGPDWQDVSAQYAIHGTRVHLIGQVRPTKDNPGRLLEAKEDGEGKVTTPAFPPGAEPAKMPGTHGRFGGIDANLLGTTTVTAQGKLWSLLLENYDAYRGVSFAQTVKGDLLEGHEPSGATGEEGTGQGRFVGGGAPLSLEGETPEAAGVLPGYYVRRCEYPYGKPVKICTQKSRGFGPPVFESFSMPIDKILANWFPIPDVFAVELFVTMQTKAGEWECPPGSATPGPWMFAPPFLCWATEESARQWIPWSFTWTGPDAGAMLVSETYGGAGGAPEPPFPVPGAPALGSLINGFSWTWDEHRGWNEAGESFGETAAAAEEHTVGGFIVRQDGTGFGQEDPRFGLFPAAYLWDTPPGTVDEPGEPGEKGPYPEELSTLGTVTSSGEVNKQLVRINVIVHPFWFKKEHVVKGGGEGEGGGGGEAIDLAGAGWQREGGDMELGEPLRGAAPLGRGRIGRRR